MSLKWTIMGWCLCTLLVLASCSDSGVPEDGENTPVDSTTPTTVKTTAVNNNYVPPPAQEDFAISSPISYANSPSFDVTWTEAPFVTKYDLYLATDELCNNPILTEIYRDIKIRGTTVGPLTDGTYYICLSALTSRKQVLLPNNHPMKVVLDTVKPTDIAISDASTVYTSTLTRNYTWTQSTDADTGLKNYVMEVGSTTGLKDLNTILIDPTLLTYDFTGEHGKTYYIRVHALDEAGNSSAPTKEAILHLDNVVPETPTAPTDAGVVATGDITFNWTAPKDDGTGIGSYYLEIGTTNGGNDILSTDVGNVLTYTFTTGVDGNSYYARVKAIDLAGNESSFSTSSDGILRDSVVPVVTSFVVSNEAADGYINTADTASGLVFATLTAANHTTVTYSDILVDPTGSVACDGNQTYPNGTVPIISATPATDGRYVVCGKLVQNLHTVYTKSEASRRDTAPPTFTSIDLSGDAADTYVNDSETNNNTNLVANLVATDQVTIGYKLTTSATTCNNGLTYGAAIPQSSAAEFTTDTTYKVCVDLIDVAGNHTYGNSSDITLDKTFPVFTSFVNANEVADGYIADSEKSATSAIGTLTASGHNALAYSDGLVDSPLITCDNTQTYGRTAEPPVDSITSDNTYAVCVRLTDVAGNITYGKGQQFVRDITGPTFSSIALAGDASDNYINAAERSNTTALAGAAVGVGHNQATYKLTLATTTCDDNLTYGATIPQSDSADFGGDVAHKICVKLDDSLNNPSAYGSSSSFTLDTSLPSFTSIALAGEAADNLINMVDYNLANPLVDTLVGTGYDTVQYKLAASTTSCNNALAYGALPSANSADFSADTTYHVCVKLTDTAGNTPSYGASSVFTFDNTGPVFSSINLINDAADGYINAAESSNGNDMVGGISATDYVTVAFALTTNATTCDSNLTYGAIPASNSAAFTTDNVYKTCIRLQDTNSNITYASSATITRDTSLPAYTSAALTNDVSGTGVLEANEVSNSTPIVGSLVASGQDSTTYKTIISTTACDGNLTYSATVPTSDSADLSVDGTYHICIKLSDSAGNPTVYGTTSTFIRDTLNPGFTSIDLNSDAADGYINFSESSNTNDLVTNLVGQHYSSAGYVVVAATTTCDGNLTYSATVPKSNDGGFTGDGTFKVCVELSDGVSTNAYGFSNNIIRDTVVPVFTSVDLNGEALDNYINLAESSLTTDLVTNLVASGHTSTGYSLTTAAITCNSGLTYGSLPKNNSGDFGSDNSYKVCVQIQDDASNDVYGSSSNFTLDKTVPAFTSIALSGDATDGYINIAETSNATSMMGAITAAGYDTVNYAIVANAITCDDNILTYSTTAPQSNAGAFGTDQVYKVCIKLTDNSGNPDAFGASPTITLDTVAPSFASVALANDANDGYINSTESGNTTAVVNAASASGHDTLAYKIATSGTTCDGNLTYATTLPQSNSSDFNSQTTFKVCVEASDLAGNPSSYGNSSNIIFDTVAPHFTSLALANEASDGYINAAEHTLSSNLTGALTALGYSTHAYKLALTSATCSALTHGANGVVPTNDASEFSAEGAYKVCVKLDDAAGNTAYYNSNTINFDETSPSFSSISLINDASDGYINSIEQTSATAMVGSPSATGSDTSGYVLVPLATTCNSGLTYNASAPNNNSGNFGANGSYKVCVKVADNAGNADYGNSSTIILDTVGEPNLDGFTAVTHTSSTNRAIDLTVDFPASHNYSSVEIRRVSGSSAPADCTAGSIVQTINNFATDPLNFTDSLLVAGTTYSYRACVSDTVGNINGNGTSTNVAASMVHQVFVTSTTNTGSFPGGISGANSLCQTRGDTLDSGETWVALLATAQMDVTAQAPISGRVYNSAGTPVLVASNYGDFWDSTLATTISVDETGTSAAGVSVFTGFDGSGARLSNHCQSWTSTLAGNSGTLGTTSGSNATAFNNGSQACNLSSRIYCVNNFMQGLTAFTAAKPGAGSDGDITITLDFPATTTHYNSVTIRRVTGTTPPAATCDGGGDTVVKTYNTFTDDSFTDATGAAATKFSYRACLYDTSSNLVGTTAQANILSYGAVHRVFVTSASYASTAVSPTAADSLCDSLGDANVAAATWKALISDTSETASGRVTISGKVFNTNNDEVASSSADFWDGNLTNPIQYDETGTTTSGTDRVWTASTAAGALAADDCSNWTDNTSGFSSQTGQPTSTTAAFNVETKLCNSTQRLYCISTSTY